MGQYEKYGYHFVHYTGKLSGEEIAKLSDAELEAYLQECRFMEEKKRYQIKTGYILREIAGKYAIVPVDEECVITNAVMLPNDTAVFFWRAFQQPSTIEDVVRKALEEYDAKEDTIRMAIRRFVKDTLKYRILMEAD